MERNIFEIASRRRFRFNFKGEIGVEDLWDLTPTTLDGIFKKLNAEVKLSNEESLLNTKTDKDQDLEDKISIVRYITMVKLSEQEDRVNAAAKKAEKQKILKVLASKEDQELENKSVEELRKMVESL